MTPVGFPGTTASLSRSWIVSLGNCTRSRRTFASATARARS
jgi:hypothetical protein